MRFLIVSSFKDRVRSSSVKKTALRFLKIDGEPADDDDDESGNKDDDGGGEEGTMDVSGKFVGHAMPTWPTEKEVVEGGSERSLAETTQEFRGS